MALSGLLVSYKKNQFRFGVVVAAAYAQKISAALLSIQKTFAECR